MTNEQRDVMIRETHDSVIRMEDKVLSHHVTLYGNGSRGLVKDMVAMKIFRSVSCWTCGVVGIAGIGMMFKLAYNHLIG